MYAAAFILFPPSLKKKDYTQIQTVLVFLHLSMLGKEVFQKQGCVIVYFLGYTPQLSNCNNNPFNTYSNFGIKTVNRTVNLWRLLAFVF